MLNWLHICLDINIVEGSIQTFVGGKNWSFVKGINIIPPEKFYLRLGIVDHSYWKKNYQFYGKVSNINIFKKTNNPCNEDIEDTLINWTDMQWKVDGDDVTEINVEDNFCRNFELINLRVPLRWGKKESQNICKKFGNGTLMDFDDPSNISLLNPNLLYGSKWDFDFCDCLWSAYKLVSLGKIINENTNKIVRLGSF